MRTHTLAGAGATVLLLGAFAAGGMTIAGERDVAKQATAAAGRAGKALARNDAAHAVAFAEGAVALAPRDPAYRMLLGQSYLKAGRFVSAGQAFADVLTIAGDAAPVAGKAALNLALAQIAQGQWDVARTTLSEYAASIPARDRGLALALAGDPNGGVEVLMAAARTPQSDARTRQNLGLALALAGRWSDARAVVATDMTAEQTNARIMAWIEFAKPRTASDQVAKLLGVTAARDDGQPVALALATPAAPAPLGAAPVRTAEAVAEPTPVAVAETAVPAAGAVVFAERHEVVQALPVVAAQPARMIVAAEGSFKTRLAAPVAATAPVAKAPAAGTWYVQIGAFDSAGVARDAWQRATRRYAALSAHTPAGMQFKVHGGAFYRLSVGGFARTRAVALCRAYRSKGGACFVRAGAGDQIAAWARPTKVRTAARVRAKGVQVAAR